MVVVPSYVILVFSQGNMVLGGYIAVLIIDAGVQTKMFSKFMFQGQSTVNYPTIAVQGSFLRSRVAVVESRHIGNNRGSFHKRRLHVEPNGHSLIASRCFCRTHVKQAQAVLNRILMEVFQGGRCGDSGVGRHYPCIGE